MMSFESARFCTINEYRQYIDSRYTPDQLVSGEDFTFMGLLKRYVIAYDAVSIPVRCTKRPERQSEHGLWVVQLAILDNDCKPAPTDVELLLADDGMTKPAATDKASSHYKEGYIRGYDDGVGIEPWMLSESKSLSQT